MIFISHRGFINGPDKIIENNPKQIKSLLDQKINVEIDIYFYKNQFYLGHDEPVYEINQSFLENDLLWCHAKNNNALEELKKTKSHFFWHQKDDYTITSRGYIWVYPGKPLIKDSICVLPEQHNLDYSKCYGVCTDNINKFLKIK
ncbi:hypothetical protein N9Y52_04930 [Candidatus Pelagibacter bacterium]|nr:hypothetical protein [Candidatus Pelagibacter bacterium]